MKNLRRICFAIILAAAFTVPALAGEVNSPPCPDPGEMNAPPCTTEPGFTQGPSAGASDQTLGADLVALGETQGPPLTWSAILLAVQNAF